MTWTLAIAAPVLLFAALVQSATGFGFSLLAGPALFALVDPVEAVGLIMVLGIGSNVLVLFTEKRELTIQRNA
ncbi:MAG: hypothetical protein FJW96_14255, partial [Actinobacteria bacterium]|nr:hypothetical protein [Actinomycetota bacterium]